MYLSKITLWPSEQSARTLLNIKSSGAYASHQLIWQLFTEQAKRDFLFREEIGINGLPEFFVLSAVEPQANGGVFNVQSKPFSPVLQTGKRLAFKLRVNPTIYSKDSSGKGKRHDVLMHAKYQFKGNKSVDKAQLNDVMNQAAIDWITDNKRLDNWGFQLDAIPEVERYDQRKSSKASGHQVQFSSVDFQGLLTVVDPQKFIDQMCAGFGRAKSMGCGLMLIRLI
ncbi:type I-E CRISPR-associated protein Cas6/Cse3/CasE [Neptunicella sp.]|uniref:type I-E CRISPR-associated protein Cas6/Cse3/CasE n=1 Tax=Neptunicella sp. TaxID=2125986 RepID=UPI003F68F667